METAAALAYAAEAVRYFVGKGWLFDSTHSVTVKLIHPEGAKKFSTVGVVFIDIFDHEWVPAEHYLRLCVLFPQQRMPLHHHKLRREMFTVVGGEVFLRTAMGKALIAVGERMFPNIDEPHGVETGSRGGAYVGVCHAEHMTDVYWQDESALQSPRLTVLDLEQIPYLPCATQQGSKKQEFTPHWESLIRELSTTQKHIELSENTRKPDFH